MADEKLEPIRREAGLNIGPGFQDWIKEHEATPKSEERYFSADMSVAVVAVAGPDGKPENILLLYNKLTNEIIPFAAAAL